jgi:heme oxygenase
MFKVKGLFQRQIAIKRV